MKKSVLLGIIGLAAGMATSYGQGYITLDNYTSGLNTTPITYLGTPLSSAWNVGLYFVGATTSAGSGLVEGAGNGIPSATLALGTGAGATDTFASDNATGNPGFYGSSAAFNTGSTTFTFATLEVIAYNGATYASSTIRGHSAAFTMATVTATSPTPIYTGDFSSSFIVTAVPEPATLALAGLGGLASLVALRRKQA
jgi:hypothetical protein